MIGDQGDMAKGLTDALMATVHEYDGTLYLSTVIGCLELVKQALIFSDFETQGDDE